MTTQQEKLDKEFEKLFWVRGFDGGWEELPRDKVLEKKVKDWINQNYTPNSKILEVIKELDSLVKGQNWDYANALQDLKKALNLNNQDEPTK